VSIEPHRSADRLIAAAICSYSRSGVRFDPGSESEPSPPVGPVLHNDRNRIDPPMCVIDPGLKVWSPSSLLGEHSKDGRPAQISVFFCFFSLLPVAVCRRAEGHVTRANQ